MNRLMWILLVVVAATVGCSSMDQDEQLLAELANLDKQTIYDRADELYEQEEWADARRYYSFVYDTFPNDPLGHKAALRVADTYTKKNDTASLTEARLRYRDFANRYPNDPDRDYALLMLGQTYAANRKRPDRDLSTLAESLDAYRQLVNLYPNSPYVEDARAAIGELRQILAEHEWQVAHFYSRNNRWRGVKWRLETLKENYPDYANMEQVDELLAEASEIVADTDRAIAEYEKAVAEHKAKATAEVDNVDDAEETE